MKRRYRVSFEVEVNALRKGQKAFAEAVVRREFFWGWGSYAADGTTFRAEAVEDTTQVEEVKP